MPEIITMALFCAALIGCIATGISIIPALVAGLAIFLVHGRLTGHTWGAMIRKGLATMRAASIVVVTFVLIGLLTTLWRAAGTVPFIVANTTSLIRPHAVILLTFLLNCLMSLLTGSSFASAATMGVITMTLGTSMQVSPMLLGGAILSGIYFGDRCSPVSTSAQLVKTLTHTNIFENIRLMVRTAAVPFALTCAAYAALALCTHPSAGSLDVRELFGKAFCLHWTTVLPAVVLVVLAVARVDVRITMCASILTALPVCVLVQHMDVEALARALVFGFHCADERVAPLIDGGGIVSMVKVMLIVCISSSYSGIFQETGLLDGAHRIVSALARRCSAFGAVDIATIMKLSRVLMLVFAAIVISIWWDRHHSAVPASGKRTVSFPWFMLGFIGASIIGTFVPFIASVTPQLVDIAYVVLGMAMAALGITVNFAAIAQKGRKAFLASFLTSILLMCFAAGMAMLFF